MSLITLKRRKAFYGWIADRISLLWWEVEDFVEFVGIAVLILAGFAGIGYTLRLLFDGNIIYDSICLPIFFGIILYWTIDLFKTWKTSAILNKAINLYIVILFSIILINQIQYFQIVHILKIDFKIIGG